MITFETFYTEAECKALWKKYSTNEHLWDLWEVRHFFHTDDFEYNFIVCYDEDELMAVLPLVFDRKSKIYTYFGDTFPERNKVLVSDPDYKEYSYDLFYQIPYYTSIYYIDKSEEDFFEDFSKGEKRYFLSLSKYNSFEDFMGTFTKKHRKNLRYDLKKLHEKDVSIEKNSLKDFEHLISFNKQRFGKDSDYNDSVFVSSMRKLLLFAQKKKLLDMVSISLSGKVEAVGLGIVYNGIYYVLNSGRNVLIQNIGKLLISEQIKNAIAFGCTEIDFLSTEAKWKDLWNLESEDTFELFG